MENQQNHLTRSSDDQSLCLGSALIRLACADNQSVHCSKLGVHFYGIANKITFFHYLFLFIELTK